MYDTIYDRISLCNGMECPLQVVFRSRVRNEVRIRIRLGQSSSRVSGYCKDSGFVSFAQVAIQLSTDLSLSADNDIHATTTEALLPFRVRNGLELTDETSLRLPAMYWRSSRCRNEVKNTDRQRLAGLNV
jgi:hypothetical protein